MTEKDKVVKIAGRVIESATGIGVAGLRVEAWDKDLVFDDLVGSSVTDERGAFEIEFGASHFQELFVDRRADLFFKVLRDGSVVESTGESVLWNVEHGATEVVIAVGPARGPQTQRLGGPWEVKGTLRLSDGSPAAGVVVSAFDRDLRLEQLLGRCVTDRDGSYKVQYFARRARKLEDGGADIFIKAAAADGSPLAVSPVLFDAPPLAKVDLVIPAEALPPPALFEKIARALAPLLGELKAEELEEDGRHQDLSFLSGETGFAAADLARFAVAHRLGGEGLRPEFWFALLGGPLFRPGTDRSLAEQQEAALNSLASLDAEAVRKSLVSTLNRGEIGEAFRGQTAAWVESFQRFVARRQVAASDSPTFVKQALEEAGVTDGAAQEAFARLFNQHGGMTPELLEALEGDGSLGREALDDLRTSFRLAELTRADFSVVRVLKEESGVRRPEDLRALAKKSEAEWVELIRTRHAAGDIRLPPAAGGLDARVGRPEFAAPGAFPEAEVYGRTLERRFREEFPTAAFAGGLGRAVRARGARGLRRAEDLGQFLERHEDFELLDTPVDEYLREGAREDFRALAGDEQFRTEVKAVQRVFKLAPTFEATDALLADGVHSAQQVYRMGEAEFTRRYSGRDGFTAESARVAWNRAADTHAAVLTIVSDLKSLEAGSLPKALQNDDEALAAFPNWENLFRAGDLCDCEHCRSVLSPAAYFADLLMFLKDRQSARTPANPGDPVPTVKDVLFGRRPDLGYLELNCENALTPLPYVDVVCEVLEDAVAAGENDVELAGLTDIPDDGAATRAAVAGALAGQGLGIAADFVLSQVSPASLERWVAHGDDVTYLLKKKATPDFYAEVLRNTKAGADELRAHPQYVNPKAYDKLREARYPAALPFDLFAEEVRAALQKTNLRRWELMRTLRGAAPPNDPTDGDIAAEYFGISTGAAPSTGERQLILVADPTAGGQRAVWGETGNPAWLDAVANVRNFLRKTGLEYEQMLALFDLPFINPDGDTVVEHLDDSCDTERKVLTALDAPKLDRIHRFLRLWRKLKGWKMWELDLVIRHGRVGAGSLDEPFLVNLFNFSEAKARLGGKATVQQTLALLGELDTGTYFTAPYAARAAGLYQRLFLDKRLLNPLDPAFEVSAVDVPGPTAEKLAGHRPVLLAALGLREPDLVMLETMTRATDGLAYITDDLTLTNLSFLWRHALLSKLLKFKAEDWRALLKVFGQDLFDFASPQAALEFLERVGSLKASGFKPDELSWLLAADRTAKAAVTEADAARFLAALRKELQAVRAEHDPARYDFLDAAPPADVEALTALLTSLLPKLNRDEAETQLVVAALRDELVQEKAVADLPAGFTFPAAIEGPPGNIPVSYRPELHFRGTMTPAQRTTLLVDASLAAVTGLPSYQEAVEELFQGRGTVSVSGLPAGFTFPANIVGAPNDIPVSYDPKLRFKGLMTAAARTTLLTDPSLAAVTGTPSYQQAVEEFFSRPRMAMKFFEPVFTAPAAALPEAVDFKALADPALAGKISHDAERRLLRFAGIMSAGEKAALDALSADPDYRGAVDSLFTQPTTGLFPPDKLWLQEADLLFPTGDNIAANLATASTRALAHLSKTLSEKAVVELSSAQLGLTPAVTHLLLDGYALLPQTLLEHLTGAFAATTGVVDYATLKGTFDGWLWANRVAALWKRWKLTLAELERVIALTGPAQLLDFQTLPLDDAGAPAPAERLLRTALLLRLRDALPETGVTLLEVLERLNAGAYALPADFAEDVELLNESWAAAEVTSLVEALDLAFPAGYLLAESWERLRRAFHFLDNLGGDADALRTLAAAVMGEPEAATVNALLRAKFGTETWLALSAEIQDVLRERKRDALTAYLLARPMPADAPGGKWEDANDLYAYYLLDVEMSACQLTSRLVQGSGSVQLFVQRCFMGLEQPDVVVEADGADGDSAWRWWEWMRKYRVWEANRKVFLWPENWIEPELRKDKSQFFRDLENELLQNELNEYTIEAAFQNYLEKLHGVAQLEIAGFYQEDDGDNAILHVFGRTTGTEPHLYYYRRYDYRQWTPWEKIELEIEGDYLIPAVVNRRLYLFWPVFKEVPDEAGNSSVPTPGLSQASFDVPKAVKKLQLRMAVSDYRQGKWTPKRVSKEGYESGTYTVEIARKHYRFFPADRSGIDGRFGVVFDGSSFGSNGAPVAYLNGAFEIAGCGGVPAPSYDFDGSFLGVVRPEEASAGTRTEYLKWAEMESRTDYPDQDFTLVNLFAGQDSGKFAEVVLRETPWLYKVSPPWHLSYMDKFLADGLMLLGPAFDRLPMPAGTWLPFFYNDKRRTFFVLPALIERGDRRARKGDVINYYPEVKKYFRELEDFFVGVARSLAAALDLSGMTPAERAAAESFLHGMFPDTTPPPYTDEQVRGLVERYFMRLFHLWLGQFSAFMSQSRRLHFKNFYHPFVCDFAKLAYDPLRGIPALMGRETQLRDMGFSFRQSYRPTASVVDTPKTRYYPKEDVDFTPDGAYSPYNWELFFHAPLLIANSLSANQQFEEARDWYHFIFNPVGVEGGAPGGSAMSRYWVTRPFFETTDPQYVRQRIENILGMLAGDTDGPLKKGLEDQVLDWRTHPFEPHRLAAYRTVAYQKTVVMKYLDNLIAWGDYLFRQDSMESINEATQLYVLAAEILGPRPKKIPPRARPPVESFNELEEDFDAFSNALVEVENLVPAPPGNDPGGADPAPLPMLYFCIPRNEKLLGYWDTVADRLYKIRHCMNIEGVVRQLALFEPPIDPAALVKAVAGGLDIGAALADLSAPLPLYRFGVMLQKANEVCADVRALGGALLAALEKKDAEALGLLRQGQELKLLDATKAIREKQIEEAKEVLEGLRKSKTTVEARRDYYRDIERVASQEQLYLDKMAEANRYNEMVQAGKIGASVISYLPAINIGASGFGGSPIASFKIGGIELGQAANLAADVLSFVAQVAANDASMANAKGSYDRRWDDWKLQERLADLEAAQLDSQIAAAEIRIALAEKELENHALQIENAKATDAFMRSKYTNEALYQWQVGQIAGVYFQSYRLAYDLAKRAEQCFRFETGLPDSSYVNFGYWDSLKKGLLSGEKLQYDLRRLEKAYFEGNRREFELTKHVSVALLDPLALVKLRETGRCFLRLPEEIFDLDYPGHYFRRIKSVSLTLPCVAGPYTTISCTLRLLKNSIRVNTAEGDSGYPRNSDDQGLPADDARFVENNVPVKVIAASGGRNDSGVFELTFRDDRYLPFEGAGVVSEWSLELFSDLPANNPDAGNPDFGKPLRQFDYGSISDAVLHVSYTAREDAGPFKNRAVTHLRNYFGADGTAPLLRLFDLRREFPSRWQRFLNPTGPAPENVFELEMSPQLFPHRDEGKTLKVNKVWVLARCTDAGSYEVVLAPPLPPPPPPGSDTFTLAPLNLYGGLHFAQKEVEVEVVPTDPPVTWRLRMTRPGGGNLQEDPLKQVMEVEEVLLVLGYEWD